MHVIPVSLEDWETKVLAESMGDVMNKKADGMLGDITSEKFYIYYQLNIVYPIGINEDERREFPTFKMKED
ncbi:hypothetical protein AX14_006355 [Amanita brunnescens Koide BX004]|nr:hypothetical protein AX14_006355 [Amanita brunnescens Koide BX004]